MNCFADEVLDELAKRSGLPKNELQDYLAKAARSNKLCNLAGRSGRTAVLSLTGKRACRLNSQLA